MGEAKVWPLERVLFALAGTVTLLSAALAIVVSEWFLALTVFVGLNQWLYVVVRACPASLVLRHRCGLDSAIYGHTAARMADARAAVPWEPQTTYDERPEEVAA